MVRHSPPRLVSSSVTRLALLGNNYCTTLCRLLLNNKGVLIRDLCETLKPENQYLGPLCIARTHCCAWNVLSAQYPVPGAVIHLARLPALRHCGVR